MKWSNKFTEIGAAMLKCDDEFAAKLKQAALCRGGREKKTSCIRPRKSPGRAAYLIMAKPPQSSVLPDSYVVRQTAAPCGLSAEFGSVAEAKAQATDKWCALSGVLRRNTARKCRSKRAAQGESDADYQLRKSLEPDPKGRQRFIGEH